MECPDQVPIYTQDIYISSTEQHNHLLAWYIQGIHFLESQLQSETCSLLILSAMAQSLLDIGRSITRFLDQLVSRHPPAHDPKSRRSQHITMSWLRGTIENGIIYCHRYSMVVLEIARMLEQKGAKVEINGSKTNLGSNAATYNSISSMGPLDAW